jgi:hypothetical protein
MRAVLFIVLSCHRRESAESLNLKLDEKKDDIFSQHFADINAEFSRYEVEFNVENWTQTQEKEV